MHAWPPSSPWDYAPRIQPYYVAAVLIELAAAGVFASAALGRVGPLLVRGLSLGTAVFNFFVLVFLSLVLSTNSP